MQSHERSDEQLMQAYQDGEAAAFDALYLRYRDPLFRYLRNQCHDQDEAEEIFQEAWFKVVRARRQWRPGQGVKPWLFQITRNVMRDAWRKHRPTDELDEEVAELHPKWPEAWLLIRDCVERLFKLLGGLSKVQRDAWLLKEEAGLSLEEIAEVAGCGRETIKSRLRYAMKRLRAGLEGCDEPVG